MNRFGIIILNWNGKEDTLKCLASLPSGAEIVVVDNGSIDDSIKAIASAFPHVTLVKTGKNLGYAGGNNVGIAYGLNQGWEFFLILNNDTIADPNLLFEMHQTMEQFPKAGILGAKIYQMKDPSRLDHLGGRWNSEKGRFDLIGQGTLNDTYDSSTFLDYVCGAALCVRRALFEQVGSFEPNFFLLWEESDLCYRAKSAGWEVRLCPKAKILHKGSASFSGGKPHMTYFYWRGRLLWLHRNLALNEQRMQLQMIQKEQRRLIKRYYLQTLRLGLALFFAPQKIARRAAERKQTRAALAGIRDFSLGRFGSGPEWIYH